VTNVTNFGAFVDVGVHQDGLVHISMLADRFVKDPHEVVKSGDLVKVKVLKVDLPRKRIALSMRLAEPAAAGDGRPMPDRGSDRGAGRDTRAAPGGRRRDARPGGGRPGGQRETPAPSPPGGALAAAFEKARKG
jgi:uncharacterized protein